MRWQRWSTPMNNERSPFCLSTPWKRSALVANSSAGPAGSSSR